MQKEANLPIHHPAWKSLELHAKSMHETHLRTLFSTDENRGQRFTAQAAGLFLDYSKNRITDETMVLLYQLARESELRDKIDAMFRGDKINRTENRAPHGATRTQRKHDPCRWKECRSRGPCSLVQDGSLRESRSKRRLERAYRQADPQRGEYRDRRIRSWAGNGL